jgi:5'-nucleotidase
MRRLPARAAALCTAAFALAGCAGLPSPAPSNPVRFVLINDVYVLDTLADGSGGLARVVTLRNRIAETGPTFFVLAGDVLSPSVLSKYYGGRQMVEALNAAKLDYATFGNHEFELPRDTLLARIAESKFKWISSNCTEADGKPFAGVRPWDTVTVQERKVGLFALTLPGEYRKYVACSDPDSAAKRAVDTLTALGARLVVGLTHQTIEKDVVLLQRDPRITLILGGHEHEHHDVTVGDRHVLKADADSRSAQFATVWGDSSGWHQAVNLVPISADLPADTAVAKLVARWQDSLRAKLGPERVVGTLTAPLEARDAVQRRGEAGLGMLVTDAMRVGTKADVAILNAGTLRYDDVMAPGPLTNYQLESIFLFADETRVVTFPLTGARLRELIEHGLGEGRYGKGAFLQVSGVAFTFDTTAPSGHRVVGELRRTTGGAVVRPDDRLTVAFPVYPACEGGDGYQVPEAKAACADRQQAPRAVDLLRGYIEGPLGRRVSPPRAGRMVAEKTTAQ